MEQDDGQIQEKARGILSQIEIGKRQMEALNKQAEMVDGALVELNSTTQALKSLAESEKGNEILVQVGSGSYLRARLDDNQRVLVGIGADLTVEKTIPDAIIVLDERGKKLRESAAKLQKGIGEVAMRISELNRQAEQMMGPGR